MSIRGRSVTGALLKKARIGGMFANNCDSDVSNPRRTGYIKYHWMFELLPPPSGYATVTQWMNGKPMMSFTLPSVNRHSS